MNLCKSPILKDCFKDPVETRGSLRSTSATRIKRNDLREPFDTKCGRNGASWK